MVMSTDDSAWPTALLASLRLGRRLVAEVPARGPGRRRAFVDIVPEHVEDDDRALVEGWAASSVARGFRLRHWEFDAGRLDGFDYDLGAVEVRAFRAVDEFELADALRTWHLRPEQFTYPWNTDDPR